MLYRKLDPVYMSWIEGEDQDVPPRNLLLFSPTFSAMTQPTLPLDWTDQKDSHKLQAFTF